MWDRETPTSWLPRLAALLVVVLVSLSGTVALLAHRGEEQMRLSDDAFDGGHLRASLNAARGAATAYFPGAPHIRRAQERMRAIALGAEAQGKRSLAREAWSMIRGSELETGHPLKPIEAPLVEAESHVVRLLEARSGSSASEDTAERAHPGLAAAYAVRPPSPFWTGSAGLGLVLMVVGTWLWGRADGRSLRATWWRACIGVTGLLLWVGVAVST